YHAGKFVAKDRRRHDHLLVVTPLEDLQIGAACQRRLDSDPDFSGLELPGRHLMDPNIFFAMENSGFHQCVCWRRADFRPEQLTVPMLWEWGWSFGVLVFKHSMTAPLHYPWMNRTNTLAAEQALGHLSLGALIPAEPARAAL